MELDEALVQLVDLGRVESAQAFAGRRGSSTYGSHSSSSSGFGAHVVSPTRPRATRVSSAAARFASGAKITAKQDATTSKAPSSNGSSCASATPQSTASERLDALSIMAGDRSTAVTPAPAAAVKPMTVPLARRPMATLRTNRDEPIRSPP